MRRIVCLLMVCVMAVGLWGCGGAGSVKATVKGTEVDLTADTATVVAAFKELGLTSYDYIRRAIVDDDGETLVRPEEFALADFVTVRKGIYDYRDGDAADYMGFREYGFGKQYCGEASVMGFNNVDSYNAAVAAGFVDTGKFAVKIYADGKEVDINSYRDVAREYIEIVGNGGDNASTLYINRGYISDPEEVKYFDSGYGLVRNIAYENYSAILNAYDKAGYKSWADDFEGFTKIQPTALNALMTVMAACHMGREYSAGNIKSLVAVLVPADSDKEQLYVSVACPGSEAAGWGITTE